MRPGRCHPGNAAADALRARYPVPSMRPGRCHPGNKTREETQELLRKAFNEAGALPPRKYRSAGDYVKSKSRPSMRPGRCHPGNSLYGTPCAAWVFHRFCERWRLCLPEHANCSPKVDHNTTYLLVIQIESALRELPALFLPLEHSHKTRQTPPKQLSPADSALHTSCLGFPLEDQLGQQAPNLQSGCDPQPT